MRGRDGPGWTSEDTCCRHMNLVACSAQLSWQISAQLPGPNPWKAPKKQKRGKSKMLCLSVQNLPLTTDLGGQSLDPGDKFPQTPTAFEHRTQLGVHVLVLKFRKVRVCQPRTTNEIQLLIKPNFLQLLRQNMASRADLVAGFANSHLTRRTLDLFTLHEIWGSFTRAHIAMA